MAESPLRNWETVVYALYLSGGASNPVHTEDIALKCYELAPDSFSWIRYPQYPDKDIVRVTLTDARKKRIGAMVHGRSGKGKGQSGGSADGPAIDGWQLTEAGVDWIVQNESRLTRALADKAPKSHRQDVLKRLARVTNHRLFQLYRDQPDGFTPGLGALADMLRCRVDAEPNVWAKRFAGVKNEAKLVGQAELLTFLERCEDFVREAMGVH